MKSIKRHNGLAGQASVFDAQKLRGCLGTMEPVAGRIVGAVANSDTEYRKEQLFALDPEGMTAALTAYVIRTGAAGALIILREEDGKEARLEAAEKAGLSLAVEAGEMVLRTEHREDLHVPADELYRAAELLAGETPGVLLAVEDGALMEADPEESVDSILKESGLWEEDSRKAVLTDHTFYTADEIAGMKAEDLPGRSGVLRILRNTDCMVDRAAKELLVLRGKSCGRCTFCREGLVQLSGRIGQIRDGLAKGPETDLMKEIASAMRVSYHCTLGEDAPMPVLSLLEKFGDEVNAHIRRKECPAGVCRAYLNYYIDPSKCAGSGACEAVCPAGAIERKAGYTSYVDAFACTRCGKCLDACPEGAVRFISGKVPRNAETPQRLKKTSAAGSRPEGAAGETEPEETAKRERSGKRKRAFAKPVKK